MSESTNTKPTTGPEIAEPTGVNLTKFAVRAGLDGYLFVGENFARKILYRPYEDPETQGTANCWSLTKSYLAGLDKLMADAKRSQYAFFKFKHWYRRSKTATKDSMVRVLARLYRTEDGQLWVQLTEAPPTR